MKYPKDNNDTLHFLKILDQYTLMLSVFLLTGRFFKILLNYFYVFGEGKKIKHNLNHSHCVKSVPIQTRKNFVFGHFSHSESFFQVPQFLNTAKFQVGCLINENSFFLDFEISRNKLLQISTSILNSNENLTDLLTHSLIT